MARTLSKRPRDSRYVSRGVWCDSRDNPGVHHRTAYQSAWRAAHPAPWHDGRCNGIRPAGACRAGMDGGADSRPACCRRRWHAGLAGRPLEKRRQAASKARCKERSPASPPSWDHLVSRRSTLRRPGSGTVGFGLSAQRSIWCACRCSAGLSPLRCDRDRGAITCMDGEETRPDAMRGG